MDSILSFDKSKEANYYEILGCDPSSSEEQIQAEYRAKAVMLHPDKNPGDEESVRRFQLLQEAKATLTDPASRALYDKWRLSGIAMPFGRWRDMAHRGQTLHWATPPAPERMLDDSSSHQPTTGKQADRNDSIRFRAAPKVWHRETSDIMRKFRNYEI